MDGDGSFFLFLWLPFYLLQPPSKSELAPRLCMIHGPELGLMHNNLFPDVTLKKIFFYKIAFSSSFKKEKMGGAPWNFQWEGLRKSVGAEVFSTRTKYWILESAWVICSLWFSGTAWLRQVSLGDGLGWGAWSKMWWMACQAWIVQLAKAGLGITGCHFPLSWDTYDFF